MWWDWGGEGGQELARVGAPLHADDVGWTELVNRLTHELLAAGRLVGLSILANGCATTAAAHLVRSQPAVRVHLHLNLTQGRPVSSPSRLGRLVDSDGKFLGLPRLAYRLVRGDVPADVVECELRAQLDRLDELGVSIVAVDSHHHVHALSPVSEVVDGVVAERGIDRGRSYHMIRTHTIRGRTKLLTLAALARASSRHGAGATTLPSSWFGEGGDPFTVASWERLDRVGFQPATTVVCHPGGSCDKPLPR